MPGLRVKMQPKYYLKTWHITTIVLAGTIIRFLYGYSTKAWLGAPDQLAWGLGIDEMLNSRSWNYLQLTHAPHEGGSFFISLLSMLFRPLQAILPSLSFAALIIDTVSRCIQVRIVQKMFGYETAVWFGTWTILSVPLLIPWATVNFGLHSLSSFIPFVFLYFAIKYKDNKHLPVICGIISGIAVSLSYDSVILAIASVLFLVSVKNDSKSKLTRMLFFFAAFILTLLPHLFTRIFLYTGSSLAGNPSFSIRGISLGSSLDLSHVTNLITVWYKPLPGSFLLSAISFLSPALILLIVFLFLLTGALFFVFNRAIKNDVKLLSICIVFLFVAAYALSPFYGGDYHVKNYVYYRHLCYIIPFLTALVMCGFMRAGKFKWWLVISWMLLCGVASIQYIYSAQKIDQPAYRPAGWVLAKKYGSDINKLFRIRSVAEPQYQDELVVGFGWGLSAAILENKHDSASVEKLIQLARQCPVQNQPGIIAGIHYSFSNGITPALDQKLLPMIDSQLSIKK